MSIDDSLRRIANQAFFERINVYEVKSGDTVDTVDTEPAEPFDVLFDLALHTGASRRRSRLRGGATGGEGC